MNELEGMGWVPGRNRRYDRAFQAPQLLRELMEEAAGLQQFAEFRQDCISASTRSDGYWFQITQRWKAPPGPPPRYRYRGIGESQISVLLDGERVVSYRVEVGKTGKHRHLPNLELARNYRDRIRIAIALDQDPLFEPLIE